jgi:hypothetical protein
VGVLRHLHRHGRDLVRLGRRPHHRSRASRCSPIRSGWCWRRS